MVMEQVNRVARTAATVFIPGESGTGTENMAPEEDEEVRQREALNDLRRRMEAVGYRVTAGRGDCQRTLMR